MHLRGLLLASAEDVRAGYEEPDGFSANQCADYLEGIGLLPLYARGKFPYLNAYLNFAFYSGCVAESEANICSKEYMLKKIKENITSRLGFDTKIVPRHECNGWIKGATLKTCEHGAYVARLSKTLGLPKKCGHKSRARNLNIPTYRKALVEFATNGEAEGESKQDVKSLETDSASVLISARAYPDTKNPKKRWVMVFFSRPTPEEARACAAENIEMLNFAVPELNISDDEMRLRRNQYGTYSCYLPFNKERVELITDAHRELLKFSPRLQKLYGFELDFEPVEI